jgi:hypothetical protein
VAAECAELSESRSVIPTEEDLLESLLETEASVVGSIPMLRSIKPVDAVGFADFPPSIDS